MAVGDVLVVEAAFGSPPLAPVFGTDLTNYVRSLSVKRGRSGVFELYRPGELSAELRNGDHGNAGWVEWSDFHKWAGVRVATSTGRSVFTGYVRDLVPTGDQLPIVSRARLEAVDLFGVWTRDTVTLESTDAAILAAGGWRNTPLDLVWLVDGLSTGIASPNTWGLSNAPILLPATIKDDQGTQIATFSAPAIETLQNGLEVEHGSVHISAGGTVRVNGRWTWPEVIYASGATPAFTLTDSATLGAGEWHYQRGSLKFASAYADYRNCARAAGTSKTPFTAGTPNPGFPADAYERLDLWCADDNWVRANAELWAKLYAAWTESWPSEVEVLLWPRPDGSTALLDAVLDATDVLGVTFITINATLPGRLQTTWSVAVEGVEHIINANEWRAKLLLSPMPARWFDAYDLSVGLLTLDDVGRGLDSGAILAP